jgi:hypothetical protein
LLFDPPAYPPPPAGFVVLVEKGAVIFALSIPKNEVSGLLDCVCVVVIPALARVGAPAGYLLPPLDDPPPPPELLLPDEDDDEEELDVFEEDD